VLLLLMKKRLQSLLLVALKVVFVVEDIVLLAFLEAFFARLAFAQ